MSAHANPVAISGGPDEWDMPTQEMAQAPEHAPFSQWTHYNPTLVEALAAHGQVPEQEVVDHLNELFRQATEDPRVRPLERQAEAVRRYVDEYVVGP